MAKQKTINSKPVFEARLEGEDAGILCVSLVDLPAVKSNFVAYAEQQPVQEYAVADEDKRRVFGCVLRADFPIYRRDENGFEYYIVFRAEQIRAFAQKMLADQRQNLVDTMHNFINTEGAECVQLFIKDTAAGIAPAGFEGIADGSLFAEYQVTDETLWERIKAGEFKGFSVAIVENDVPVQETYSSKNMTILEKVKAALAKGVSAVEQELAAALETYGRIATDKGVLVWAGEDTELAEGVSVWSEGEDGNRIELEDGEYLTNDSRIVVVEGGIVKEVKAAPVPEQPAEAEPAEQPETEAEQAEEGAPEAEAAPEAEQPVEDEKDKRIAELEDRVASLVAENEALTAENEELKAKLAEPAAQSAHEAYKAATEVKEQNTFEQIRALKKKRAC